MVENKKLLKNEKLFFLLFIAFIFILPKSVHAQGEHLIQGIVTAFDSIPLVEVSVKVKSTKQVVLSDSIGNFSVNCAPKDKLLISAKGFYERRIKIRPATRYAAINLKLKSTSEAVDYAIGNGHVTDKEKFRSISLLSKETIDYSKYNSVFDIIQANFSGLMIFNGQIWIRGPSSLYSNDANAAMIVLDGVVVGSGDIKTLPTTRIKSIKVVKDGSGAIYGTRGGTGVVIVETKKYND